MSVVHVVPAMSCLRVVFTSLMYVQSYNPPRKARTLEEEARDLRVFSHLEEELVDRQYFEPAKSVDQAFRFVSLSLSHTHALSLCVSVTLTLSMPQ